MAGDDNFDSIRLRCSGIELEQWPKLSCSEVGLLDFDLSNLRLDGDRSLQFQGNGQIRTAGNLRVFTDGGATEKLTLLANGNVGIGNSAPTTKLEVSGAVKASSFQGDGSTLGGVVKKTGDTMTGALTVSGTVKADVFEGKFSGDGSALTNLAVKSSQWADGANNAVSYSAGSVGIGTTTPQSKLDVRGNLTLETAGNPAIYTGTGKAELNRYLNLLNSADAPSVSGLKAGGILVADVLMYGNPGKNDLIVKGNVGIGTNQPSDKLEIVTRNFGLTVRDLESGSVSLNLKNSKGFWHISGPRSYEPNNNLSIYWNNNSQWVGPYLTIADNGNVGIGTNSPKTKFQVAQASITVGPFGRGDDPIGRIMVSGGSGEFAFTDRRLTSWPTSPAAGDRFVWYALDKVARLWTEVRGDVLSIDSQGIFRATGSVSTPSSRELKEEIFDLSADEAVQTLLNLNPVQFRYKSDEQKERHLGFIAEDLPELVANPDRKTITSMKVVSLLTKVVQEQQKTISDLQARVELLENNDVTNG